MMPFILTLTWSGKLFRYIVFISSALLTFLILHPVMAIHPLITDDARVSGDDQWQLETSLRVDRHKFENSNLFAYGQTDNFDKESENMEAVADSVAEPSWICKLVPMQLPKTAYALTENWIPKLLGVQLLNWAPKLLGMQFTGIYQNMPAFHAGNRGKLVLSLIEGNPLGDVK